MKITTIYSDKDGILRACVEPVPVEPKRKREFGTATEFIFKKEWNDYASALQHCKDSSVPFEDQSEAIKLINVQVNEGLYFGSGLPLEDAFYKIREVEVEIIERCENCGTGEHQDCKDKSDGCDYVSEKLARLSPVAPEPSFKPDTLIIWLEKERNLLQNTGSMMWHKPDEQRKTLEVAKALDMTLKYIYELYLK